MVRTRYLTSCCFWFCGTRAVLVLVLPELQQVVDTYGINIPTTEYFEKNYVDVRFDVITLCRFVHSLNGNLGHI